MSSASEIRLSPDGKYQLVIHTLSSEKGWNNKRVEVRGADDRLIGETTRNFYRDEIYHFVSQDGKDYLILSEDYHGGYGCMDLASGEKSIFTPRPREPHEQFWIWLYPVAHDPAKKTLTVGGCYWCGALERATYDFSNPMSAPYPQLSIESDEEDED